MSTLLRLIVYLWASPVTLLGLLISMISRLTGGGCHAYMGVWEAWGGWPAWVLKSGFPFVGPVAAIAIGHVVLAVTEKDIHDTRAHERAHVRQYEWWGPLFLLAYPLAGAWAWINGRDPYRDNPFERAARKAERMRI